MKKAAIKVSANLFQEMLKLPFGVAIEDVVYDSKEHEFTVIIFGDRMEDEAEMEGDMMRIANYEVSPLWHKGRITLTEEMIKWPVKEKTEIKENLKKEAKDEKLPIEEIIDTSVGDENLVTEESEEKDDGDQTELEGKQSRQKPDRKRKSR